VRTIAGFVLLPLCFAGPALAVDVQISQDTEADLSSYATSPTWHVDVRLAEARTIGRRAWP
jgi:hypothetical protein